MASLPRGLAARVVGLAARSRTATLRPIRIAPPPTCRALSSFSFPAWKQAEMPCTSRPSFPTLSAINSAPKLGRRSSSTSVSPQQLEEQVLSVMRMFDKVKPEKVTLEAHFINDLGMDSLDAVEVVMAFEDEFGVEITDEEAEKIFTCQDAVELLKTKLDIH